MHQRNVNFVTIVFFKDIGFEFEVHVCDKCHDLLTTAYYLKDIVILNSKGATLDVFGWVLVKIKV